MPTTRVSSSSSIYRDSPAAATAASDACDVELIFFFLLLSFRVVYNTLNSNVLTFVLFVNYHGKISVERYNLS